MFDAIVFTQSELDNAIKNNAKNICLCDGSFLLPLMQDTVYYALGDVKATAMMTFAEAIKNNIIFDGFVPEFCGCSAKKHSASKSSRSGSYQYEYEYEYATSFGSIGSRSSGLVSFYRSGGSVVFVGGYGVNLI